MFTLQYAKNPIYNSEDEQQILLTVKWEEFVEEMPFNACSFDPEEWGRDLYNRAKAGEFGEVAP
ncbi:MAG: phage tail protein, partial [Bacteroidetes bacterium]|nr:phage tail protein [Bacteroidota bacterium]